MLESPGTPLQGGLSPTVPPPHRGHLRTEAQEAAVDAQAVLHHRYAASGGQSFEDRFLI